MLVSFAHQGLISKSLIHFHDPIPGKGVLPITYGFGLFL